jgi:hypothetical protein
MEQHESMAWMLRSFMEGDFSWLVWDTGIDRHRLVINKSLAA